ncbi:MAG: sulfite reductase subunit alpha [Pseudomonadota bacterium]
MTAPFIPDDAPFSDSQRAWLAGFLAGMAASGAHHSDVDAGDGAATQLDILFGTQTGNAETVAQEAASLATANGMAPRVRELNDIDMAALTTMKHVIVVVSTYGEGEMPDNAQMFWDAVSATTAPRLEGMRYGVLALGDTSYDQFCQAGKLIDMRFEQLGASRLAARIDCDVDFEDVATEWLSTTVPLANDGKGPGAAASALIDTEPRKSVWTRKNPYASKVIENRLLSGITSAKEIRHFSFDLGDSGMSYEAGDALGVMPVNSTDLVNDILVRLRANADQEIKGHDEPLGVLLKEKLEIRTPSKQVITEVEKIAEHDELSHVLGTGDKESLEAFLWGRDTLDLLNLNADITIDPAQFVSWLKPLQHRAYSISSSPKAHDGEVQLTVAAVRWKFEGRGHNGVASTFLSDMCTEGDDTPIFMSPNKSFRIPEDSDAPMIMVGPGTGVAPFRAFLEERREIGAKGRNWLFFGDQHRDCDFIYADEISDMSRKGLLTRLDLAFSRDQDEKIYVQTRMRENARTLFEWLEEGGYFYVCGDATRMAKDVDIALADIIKTEGSLSDDAAMDYVNKLKKEKRYLRDVY